MQYALLVVAALAVSASATVYFQEKFTTPNWESRWINSKAKGDLGAFKLSAGKYYNDAEADKGLQTSQDARFYAASSKFDSVFNNEGKPYVVQFSVKHEQNIDCGGGYVKIFPSSLEQTAMHGESPYNIMFGPDICGPGHRKVHVIFANNGKNHLIKKNIPAKTDEASHLYTLILNPDNTYEVRIDDVKVESGSLLEDWDILPPKQIPDPAQKKPADWVDQKEIDDPSDSKPADWDKPETIADTNAKKPEDWDDEMDGEWEAPQIPNPDYKGEWKPKKIPNPAYKGEWVHPLIDNPDYVPNDKLYHYNDSGFVGLDLWQVKSGTIFDNFLITDDLSVQKEWADAFAVQVKGEAKAKAAAEEAAKAAEKAAAAAKVDDDNDDEEEDDEEDDKKVKDEL